MVCPSKPRETKCRDIPGFCPDILGVPEKFEKKKFVFKAVLGNSGSGALQMVGGMAMSEMIISHHVTWHL